MNITALNTHKMRLACASFSAAFLTLTSAFGQTMPQDNWRYDGLQFASPTTGNALGYIAIGSGGVYVVENSTKILQFTEGGIFVRRFSVDFSAVSGIACDPSGNVYVADQIDAKVRVFNSNGTFVREWGSVGTNDGQFSQMGGIAVDRNNQVYVCDPGNTRVQVFDIAGNFLRKWGESGELPGQFKAGTPTQIAVADNGTVYTVTRIYGPGNQMRVFDVNGNYLAGLFGWTNNGGNSDPASIALSKDGLLGVGIDHEYYGFGYSTTSILAPSDSNQGVAGGAFGSGNAPRYVAFSSRGDLFIVEGTQVTVYEREYSNVQNSLLPPAIPQPEVISAAQRPGTSWMDINYQVTDADSATVTTGVLAFTNGGTTLNDAVVMNTFMENTGANVGSNITTGVIKHLTWNMAADWTVDFAQVQVEALAKDNRSLLGIHWITIPASGGNPSIQVSAAPISDGVLLDVWLWLVATHQAGISLNNGTITGTANPFNGATLVSGSATTADGRNYLFGLLNVRAITADEITRAQGGSYGFSSVDANSVVKVP